jgi:hypothetical protein
MAMLIYLDTMLWNVLFDQKVDPGDIKKSLASGNANLVPGPHVFYEMLKSFHSPEPRKIKRGKQLLEYFAQFVSRDTPAAKDNMELLLAEIDTIKRGPLAVEMFLSRTEREVIRKKIEKFATGMLDEKANKFLADQKGFALQTRAGQKDHLQNRDDIKAGLKSISEENLHGWLQQTTLANAGKLALTHHIHRIIPGIPIERAAELALILLAPPIKRFARGVVRADLYYNWRCANRDSVPRDLIDDMYHVLNAVYCDVYATAERKQAEYAHLILTSNTKVAVYDDAVPVVQWIESLS